MKKNMKKSIAFGLSLLMITSAIPTQSMQILNPQTQAKAAGTRDAIQTPAFPGAEGGGMYASGGRGYDVYVVTNLEDYAANETPIEGSLRNGLNSNTTIVFHVAGNIELKRTLRFDNLSNITIAGQTAPGDGITISGWDTNISNSENIIIRYIRFRPGAINVHNGSDSMDALWGRDNDTFIIDHCSFSWNTDETLSIYRGENGTVQWSMIYESLTLSGHSKGRHGYGGISGGDSVTFHHNLYANHTSRNPRIGGGYAGYADADHVAVVDISNNLIYNWGFNTCYGGGYAYTNFRNNYELAGPGTRDNVAKWVIDAGEYTKLGGFYVDGNYIVDYSNPQNGILTEVLDKNSEYVQFSGAPSGENMTSFQTAPYLSTDSTGINAGVANEAFDSYTPEEATSIYEEIVSKSGATYPKRDSLDARIAAETETGLGRYINTEHQVGGFITAGGVITDQREDGYDTDSDGMPDSWEQENGLNPADASDRNSTTLSTEGYTNLEVYLNSLVSMDHVAENPTVAITSPANNNYFNQGDTISISVNASSEFGHAIEKVEFYCSTEAETKLIGTVNQEDSTDLNSENLSAAVGVYTMDLDGLRDGSYFISARAYDVNGNQTQTTAAEVHVNINPQTLENAGWQSSDVGNPAVAGTGSFADGILTIKGNGKLGSSEGSVAGTDYADATKDDFYYIYKEVTGDVEVVAKLESITSVDNHAFAGIMVRDDLTDGAATAALGLSWVKYTNLPWSMYLTGRDTAGGNFDKLSETLDSQSNAEAAGIALQPDIPFKNGLESLGYWMKLVRKDNKFSAYSSADGQSWYLIGQRTVAMDETVYVGFAADSNKVANDIEQVNTARFSNVKVNTVLHDVTYDLSNLTIDSAPTVAADGESIYLTLRAEDGYQVPEYVEVSIEGVLPFQKAVDIKDKLEGSLVIEHITGSISIKAVAVEDSVTAEQVRLTTKDENNYLSVTWDKKAMILNQTATTGQITQNITEGNEKPPINVSYLLFPETNDAGKMEMDIIITAKADNTNSKGLFVGAFEAEGNENFLSLGFRNGTSQSLTGYWIKNTGAAGNGGSTTNNGSANTKPSYQLNEKYHVIFEKVAVGLGKQYKVSYTGVDENGNAIDAYKLFKESECKISEDDMIQYGLALIGVTAKVENLTYTDSRDRVIYDQNVQMIPDAVDKNNLLNISEVGTTIILDQTATTGKMTKSAGEQAQNVSYYVFPKTADYQTMELDLKISDYYITGNSGKTTGVFVGAFQLDSPESFLSLGFRGYESTIGTDSLSAYWIKGTGSAGNGSPKYAVDKNVLYHVTFEKTETNGYWVYFTNTVTGVSDKKQFKTTEQQITLEDEVNFGLALVGAKAEIKNMTLKNSTGKVIYDQNDYVSESGTAPTVTGITTANVNADRTAIDLSWFGEGAEGDGRYVVEVSRNGGAYIRTADTYDTSYSYPIENSGSYIFKIYGICGSVTTEAVYSEAVIYRAPIKAPDHIYADNTGNVLTISWDLVEEANAYEVYRAVSKNGNYMKIDTTTETSYADSTFVLEQPYYYYVVAIDENNSSNPSDKIFIMASNGHTGDYVYGKEAPQITITEKPNDTVTSRAVTLAGEVNTDSTVKLYVNGNEAQTATSSFSFDITLAQGRNEIELLVEAEDGRATRKTFNFVYVTDYDLLVDAAYTGTEGELLDGVPVYKTVGSAIQAASGNGAVIFIKNGRYYEKLTIDKKNIILLGEDSEQTVLYYDVASGSKDANGNDYGTSGSASITINASGFSAENLTISNEFDYVKAVSEGFQNTQAVALLNKSDGSIFTNVRMYGYQDTLYAHSNNQYYYKCYITGNVDYIFGGARAVFEDCDIVNLLPGYVTAASTEAAQEIGYVFDHCRILGAAGLANETVYLGRPWRPDASVTYVNCYLEAVVRKIGYCDMSGNSYKTARFAEYGSYGPGFAINSDRIQLSEEEGAGYNKADVFGSFDVSARYLEISKAYIR